MAKLVRIIEIDATPQTIPSEVEKLLRPLLQDIGSGFEMKAGELYDADHPQSHSSYYVAVRCEAESQQCKRAADDFLGRLVHQARAMRLPVTEVQSDHAEFPGLVREFGW